MEKTKRQWMWSAKEWSLIAEQSLIKRDRRFAERECWLALFHAVTGL